MMAFVFLLLFISLLFIWFKKGKLARWSLVITLIVALFFFIHHVTSHLAIQL